MNGSPHKILLMLSGGPDSVYLFWQLLKFKNLKKLEFSVIHFNHNLRAQASDQDAQFVQTLCRENQIECFIENLKFNNHVGLQYKARNLRYKKTLTLAQSYNFTHIATAHHLDDQIETLTMRKSRGTGLRGFCGISPLSKIKQLWLWRPLLQHSKAEILEWLESQKKAWRIDSSNFTTKYFRNRARIALQDATEQKKTLKLWQKQHDFLCLINHYFNKRVRSFGVLNLPLFAETDFLRLTSELQFRITQHLAHRTGLKSQWTRSEFYKIKSQKSVLFLKEIEIIHDQHGIWFFSTNSKMIDKANLIEQPGAYYFGDKKLKLIIKKINPKLMNFKNNILINLRVNFPLTVSHNSQRFEFLAFGKLSPINVNEYLKSKKINKWLRAKWPVLLDQHNHITAVLGIEVSQSCRVNPEDTQALSISCNWLK